MKAYGYLRVSHRDSAESGLGLNAQAKIVRRYFRRTLAKRFPDLEWGGFVVDKKVSAYKKPFIQRPGGQRLNMMLQKGDHVLFARMDRGFRNSRDFAIMMPLWEGKGVSIHYLDTNIDTSIPIGKLVLTVLAAVAQMDSDYKSERSKETWRILKKQGVLGRGKPPPGFKGVSDGKRIVAVPDRKQQVVLRYIRTLREQQGLSFDKISDRIESILAVRDKRKPALACNFRVWDKNRVKRAYNDREKLIVATEH